MKPGVKQVWACSACAATYESPVKIHGFTCGHVDQHKTGKPAKMKLVEGS